MSGLPSTVDRFPDDFLWGTATAAHQVEGGNHLNDWWAWEEVPGHIKNGDRSDPACDHYRRYCADFDLLKSLHQNAHRLSLEWSRIEPEPGRWSGEALAHYADVLTALRERGLRPLVTLHHFTNPRWLRDWEAPDVADRFVLYADRVVTELGSLADDWITLNEPTVIAYQGFVKGEWPPGKRNLGAAARALTTMLRAHWMAYARIKARRPDARIGIAHHLRVFDPARWFAPQDRAVAAMFERVFNETMLRSLRQGRLVFPLTRAGRASGPPQAQDFIGLNYYTRELVRFNRRYRTELFGERVLPANAHLSDLQWEIYPEGLYRKLRELRREDRPIFITENGIADHADAMRPEFLVGHARAMLRAINSGVPLRGYFHWTSFDNFEWAEGYGAKFGLVACDPSTQERRVRPSGRLYAEICRTGRIPVSVEAPPEPSSETRPAGPPDLR